MGMVQLAPCSVSHSSSRSQRVLPDFGSRAIRCFSAKQRSSLAPLTSAITGVAYPPPLACDFQIILPEFLSTQTAAFPPARAWRYIMSPSMRGMEETPYSLDVPPVSERTARVQVGLPSA